MLRAVSANLGRRIVAADWIRTVLSSTGDQAVDLVFLQEAPLSVDWANICHKAGFGIARDSDPTWHVWSLLLWRRSTVEAEPLALPTAGYHGSYLAAARLNLPSVGATTAVSVHASPTVVEARYRKRWSQTGLPLPEPRPSAGPGELWDSDFVLATLADLALKGPVLAAGDFNECLAWDAGHPGEWGKEYFVGVANAGLVSLSHRDDAAEKRTAFTHDELDYQLDHVLASPDVAEQILQSPIVDTAWSRERVIAGELSDHSPLWFEIESGSRSAAS